MLPTRNHNMTLIRRGVDLYNLHWLSLVKNASFVSGSGKWFEMQDLHVDKILPETLPLSEAFIQIYELQSNKNKSSWGINV